MNDDQTLCIDESIKLEQHVADLYYLFSTLFPEDADFWWQLTLEEKNHAELIRNGKEHFAPLGIFPHSILSDRLEELQEMNDRVCSLLKKYEGASPSREEACNIAVELEMSAGEVHFQEFMNAASSSSIDEIFKKLCQDDKDHAERILAYMADIGCTMKLATG